MKAAVIAPVPLLEKYATQSTFHMVLAHLVLECPEYRAFYSERGSQGEYLLLDNGIVEKGEPLPMRDIVAAADMVGADEIILPDALFNADRTLLGAAEAMLWLEEQGLLGKYKLMAAPHGHTPSDWLRCFGALAAQPVISVIGISKFTESLVPAREGRLSGREAIVDALDLLGLRCNGKEYHLLGIHGDPLEVLRCAQRYPWIRSIDSCIAVLSGQHGVRFPDPLRGAAPYARPKEDFDFYSGSDPYPDITEENIRLYLAWAQRGVA